MNIVKEEIQIILNKSITENDFIERVIHKLDNNKKELKDFLFYYFYVRLERYLLINYFTEKNNIDLLEDIDYLIPIKNRKLMISKIQNEMDFLIPKPELSWSQFFIISGLLLIPLVIIMFFVIMYVELIFLLYEAILSGFIFILILTVPYVIYLIKPSFFLIYNIPNVKTFNDFINEIVNINIILFQINDYCETRKVLSYWYKNGTIA